MLERLDHRIRRLEKARPHGVWRVGTYLLAADETVVASGLGFLRGVFLGESSATVASSTSLWTHEQTGDSFNGLTRSISRLEHPTVVPDAQRRTLLIGEPRRTPSAILSGSELAVLLAPPQQSVCGLAVARHPSFGQQVSTLGAKDPAVEFVTLGAIFDQGKIARGIEVDLDVRDLSGHVFVAGATGTGKTSTVQHLLRSLGSQRGVPYLVIEPVKNEYECMGLGARPATLLTAGEPGRPWLSLNPLRFPSSTHVLSHIDRLCQVFNAAFPMYASMPALLEEAVRRAYLSVGWDLTHSRCRAGLVYPSLVHVLSELEGAVEEAGYSDRVMSDFTGALTARLRSLTRGLRRQLLCPLPGEETTDQTLFEAPCVVNLRAIASPETKALVMGLLLTRLAEYREGMHDRALRESGRRRRSTVHVTVIEEAHTLLRRVSLETAQEGANLRGMAVEMFTNAIAEMRAFGESIVVVDQSPTTLDTAVLKHTNTKIIHRLPYEQDRLEAAATIHATTAQADELGRLPTGVAAVYQNDWLEPVLCKVEFLEAPLRRRSRQGVDAPTFAPEQLLVLLALAMPDRIHVSHVDELLEDAGTARRVLLRQLSRRLGQPEIEPWLSSLFDPSTVMEARQELVRHWNDAGARLAPDHASLVALLQDKLQLRDALAVRRDVKAILEGRDPLSVARRHFWSAKPTRRTQEESCCQPS